MNSRRSFLSAIGATILGVVQQLFGPRLTRREAAVIAYLQTRSGKEMLAKAMMRPIRCGGKDYPRAARAYGRTS